MPTKVINLAGLQFGLLRVIEPTPSDGTGRTKWRCECRCGESVITRGSDLREGTKRRCSPKCQYRWHQMRAVFSVVYDGQTRFGNGA